jgi:hypothetical protein
MRGSSGSSASTTSRPVERGVRTARRSRRAHPRMLADVFHIHAQVSRRDNHGALTFEQRRPRLVLIVTTAGNMRQWYPYNGHHLSHAAHDSETPIERWSERFRGTTPDQRVSASATKLAPWIQSGSDEPNLVTCVVEPSTPHIHARRYPSHHRPTNERLSTAAAAARSRPSSIVASSGFITTTLPTNDARAQRNVRRRAPKSTTRSEADRPRCAASFR